MFLLVLPRLKHPGSSTMLINDESLMALANCGSNFLNALERVDTGQNIFSPIWPQRCLRSLDTLNTANPDLTIVAIGGDQNCKDEWRSTQKKFNEEATHLVMNWNAFVLVAVTPSRDSVATNAGATFLSFGEAQNFPIDKTTQLIMAILLQHLSISICKAGGFGYTADPELEAIIR